MRVVQLGQRNSDAGAVLETPPGASQRDGTPMTEPQYTPARPCAAPGCDKPARIGSNYCKQHVSPMSRPGAVVPPITVHADRFWSNVDKSAGPEGCWLWLPRRNWAGYGSFSIHGKVSPASRVAWEMAHGPIPVGMEVCHNCPGGDNPACVNPAHLWLGTHQQNMQDMIRKGRGLTGAKHSSKLHPESVARGESVAGARLTAELVRTLRAEYAAGNVSYSELEVRYGVSRAAIHRAVTRVSWRHID